MNITKLYQTQISLTEWFQRINHEKTATFKKEDNDKRERLNILNKIIGLPFDKPYQFRAINLVNQTEDFKNFLKTHGEELCALRLIPLDEKLPKLRMRGYTIKDSLKWFAQQKVDPNKYNADFVPHSDNNLWATIFIVNNKGIFGEIIKGEHCLLTQGFYEQDKPIIFSYDFKEWRLTEDNPHALEEVTKIINCILVRDIDKQKLITTKLKSRFVKNYLEGYFETVTTKENGLWFIGYNQYLGGLYEDFFPEVKMQIVSNKVVIRGRVGSRGKVTGKVRVIMAIENAIMDKGEVLVCEMTTPEHIPLMEKSSAIITNKGGILTHAAIISRELKIPCIVGTENATKLLKDGDIVEVDANEGVVRILR